MEMFAKATRLKLRFDTNVGRLSVEDLWDLPLVEGSVNLDNLWKQVKKALKEEEEDSFVQKKQNIKKEILLLKLNILEYIMKTRMEEKEKVEEAKKRKQQKEKLLKIMESIEEEEMINKLKSMSPEDRKKFLENL